MMKMKNKMKISKYYKRKKRNLCILTVFNVRIPFSFFPKTINLEDLLIELLNMSNSKL